MTEDTMTTETAPATETTPVGEVQSEGVGNAGGPASTEVVTPSVYAEARASGSAEATPRRAETPLLGDYGFDTEASAAAPEELQRDKEEAAAAYSVEWPEGYEASDELTGMVNEVARECGVSDKALGAYTARMIEVLEAQHMEQVKAADAELKAEWGRDYNANMRDVKAFGEPDE